MQCSSILASHSANPELGKPQHHRCRCQLQRQAPHVRSRPRYHGTRLWGNVPHLLFPTARQFLAAGRTWAVWPRWASSSRGRYNSTPCGVPRRWLEKEANQSPQSRAFPRPPLGAGQPTRSADSRGQTPNGARGHVSQNSWISIRHGLAASFCLAKKNTSFLDLPADLVTRVVVQIPRPQVSVRTGGWKA